MIFDGAEVALDTATQTPIAAWVYLRWLVLQAAATPRVSPSFVPSHYYREMAEHHRPPATARIWLGCLDTTDFRTSVFNFANLDSLPPGTILREMTTEAYYSTLHIGRLIMRVFLYAALPQASSQLGMVINPPFDVSLLNIWPPNLDKRTWPGRVLDQRSYAGLIRTIPGANLERQRVSPAN